MDDSTQITLLESRVQELEEAIKQKEEIIDALIRGLDDINDIARKLL